MQGPGTTYLSLIGSEVPCPPRSPSSTLHFSPPRHRLAFALFALTLSSFFSCPSSLLLLLLLPPTSFTPRHTIFPPPYIFSHNAVHSPSRQPPGYSSQPLKLSCCSRCFQLGQRPSGSSCKKHHYANAHLSSVLLLTLYRM